MTARPAAPADIPFIMTLERLPGNEDFIGQWSAAEHEAALASVDTACFIWESAGAPCGFAILQKLTPPSDIVLLKRLATATPGGGHGRAFLAWLIGHVFAERGAWRFELDVSVENPRAFTLYEKMGFVREGCVRDVYRRGDRRISSYLYAILRPDWEAAR